MMGMDRGELVAQGMGCPWKGCTVTASEGKP